ncbi:MAG: hypothetical protein IJ079_09985 [Lachnospiraceae bacterium]|nr:hypothetical protein [Lachnospiraceae bacterium]
MAIIVKRDSNQHVLKPLQQYLKNQGIPCELQYEWTGVRGQHGDVVLLVEEEFYESTMELLDNIDTCATDDGVELRDAAGRTVEEQKRQRRIHGKYMAWLCIGFILAGILYIIIRYK